MFITAAKRFHSLRMIKARGDINFLSFNNRSIKHIAFLQDKTVATIEETKSEEELEKKTKKVMSPRVEEFRKKLRETTPISDLGEQPTTHPAQEKEPLPSWPDGINPVTGEVDGPRGPEPTRYGDWERKGRVSDF